jgi:N6-L-threonylcarbamoyladenine synthase/protein kinase Bud32
MGDNGTMIAYTGLLMLASGESLSIEDSVVIPDFRPDQVDATWR